VNIADVTAQRFQLATFIIILGQKCWQANSETDCILTGLVFFLFNVKNIPQMLFFQSNLPDGA
jgi:hypothetical protein